MQVSSKLLFRTAIVMLGVMLALTVFVTVSSQGAKATTPSQWETLRGYINDYYGGPQSADTALNGEAGFRMGKVELWNRLDSNGDISPNYGPEPAVAALPPTNVYASGVLGEGDDAAYRPVLIDNLMTRTDFIPGTEFRCNWNVDGSCFADTSITAIREIVDNHQAAGFSTDIVDHCVSSQTAGPSTGGFGIIAQVPGALASDTSLTPNVYIADYSRNGWRNNLSNADGTGATTSPEASAGGFGAPGTPPGTVLPTACDALSDLALVECSANWAISATGGNVSNGQTSTATIGGAGQSVDVRGGTINTMASAGVNMQVPISTLFSTSGLANLSPTLSTVLTARTQMGSTAPIGLKMLGYNLIAGGSINGGISRWAGAEGEDQAFYGPALPLQSAAAFTVAGKVDTTGPSVSSVGDTNVTATTADIERVAGEPATLKVEYGTTSGVYTDEVNSTVLNATKDAAPGNGDAVQLTGLSGGTTYYYKTTSYDGQANGTASAEGSFTTADCADGAPTLGIGPVSAFWGSYADYTAGLLSITYPINNSGATNAVNVQITGSSASNGVTLASAVPATVGNITAGTSAPVTLQYSVPVGVAAFVTTNNATAQNICNNTFSYGPALP